MTLQIRPAHAEEAPVLAIIETSGFPPAEAASLESIRARLRAFPEQFFVAETDGKAVGFINGCACDTPKLPDAYYHDATLHRPNGAYAAVFGLVVLPEYRSRGIAGKLLQHYLATMRARGKRGVILTCKTHLIPWYESHGFTNHGVADSSHGGATWYDMKVIWNDSLPMNTNTRQTLNEILTADEARLQRFIARHLPLLRELGESWQRFQQEAVPASTESAAASEIAFFDSEDVPQPPVSAESPAASDEEKSQAPREASAATYNPLDWPGTETPPQPAADTNAADNAAAAAPMTDDTSSAAPPPPASTLHKLDDELQIDLTKSAPKPEPAMPIPPHTPTPAPQPQPRITLSPLPPANEGQPYERKLPPDSPVLNIAFAQDCGLAWDDDARRIHGTPTISGDVQLTITISHDGKQHDIIQPLHINPDPKSLWQDKPSDQSAPFAKPDSIETLQDTPRGRLLAARVRGRSHAHVGSYCDDDYRINWHEASGIHLLIVSDGAGSASHARLGSQLAVNTAADTILNLLNEADKGYHRLAQLNSEQRAQISEFLIARALHAAHSAHRAAAQETGIAEKALSCTLLIALTLPLAGGGWYSAGYQVGDGAAALWLPEGDKLHLLGTADSGAYSGETQFLTAAQLQPEDYRRRIRSAESASAPHVILMTDGVSDAKFETDAALADAQHWRTFWQDGELQAALAADDPKAALHDWLGFWSRGNHDDRTIAFFLPAAGETQT